MSRCEEIRPLLYRVAEGETDPDEAMRTARHLSDCTSCRILLARERRLARMLEEDLMDPLPVGEDFVREVMARVPAAPPPRRRRRRRNHLTLAGLFFIAPLLSALVDSVRIPAQRLVPSIPTFDLETPRQVALLLLGLGRILATAMDTVAGGIAPRVQFLGGGLLLVPVLLFGAILALAGVATVAWAIAAARGSASHAA